MNIYAPFRIMNKTEKSAKNIFGRKVLPKICFERRNKPCLKIMQEKTPTEQAIKTAAAAKTKLPTKQAM